MEGGREGGTGGERRREKKREKERGIKYPLLISHMHVTKVILTP